MKKKLLISTDNFLPRWDGIARFLSDIIPSLVDDFDITVLAPDFKGERYGIKNVKIVRLSLSKKEFGDIRPAKAKFKLVKKYVKEADIVWTHALGPMGILGIFYGRKFRKTVVSTIHSFEWELFSKSIKFFRTPVYVLTKIVASYLYNKCSLLIVPSLEVAEIMTWIGVRTKKKVIHIGVDTERFSPPENKEEAKGKVEINAESVVIGFTGRIAREKDLMTLYRAFLRLKREYENVLLMIVADGLEEQKKIFESTPRVRVTGSVDNIVPYLQAMDIFVLPSLTETSSLATMEAMASGLPVLVTKVGYVKRYVKDKENGLFFPKKNDLVLYMKLKQLVEDEKFRRLLSKHARATIVSRHQWKQTTEEIKKVFEGL